MSFYSITVEGLEQLQILLPQFIEHVIETTTWDQILLGIFGVIAIRFTQDPRESRQKLAPVIGIIGQPFWLYATWNKELWVMFFICCLYTDAWLKGIKRWYFPEKKK